MPLFIAGPDPLACPQCGGHGEIAVRKPGVPEPAWPSRICTSCIDGRVRCGACGERPAAYVVERERVCAECHAEAVVLGQASGDPVSGEAGPAADRSYGAGPESLQLADVVRLVGFMRSYFGRAAFRAATEASADRWECIAIKAGVRDVPSEETRRRVRAELAKPAAEDPNAFLTARASA